MDEGNGVFLLSKNLSTGFMMKCMQVLQENFPGIAVTSIASDELHFGYRVYFSSPQKDIVVRRKHLMIRGEEVPIGFLRTTLTVHGVRKNGGKQLENEIQETICNKFGKHLYFDHALSTENETTRKLRACVDVPELEELEIFNHEGYPDMFICLPSNNEMLKVTFYCRWCNRDEHARRNCPNIKMKKEVTEKSNNPCDFKTCTSGTAKFLEIESPCGYDEKTRKEETLKGETLPERNPNNKEVKQGPTSISMKVNKEVNIIPKNEKQDLNFNIDDEVQEIDCSEGSSNHSNGHYSLTFKSEDKDDERNPRGDFKSNSKKLPCFEKPFFPSHGSAMPSTVSLVPSPLKPAAAKKENDVRKSFNEDFNSTSTVEEFSFSHTAGPSSKHSVIPMNAATAVEDRKISIPAIQAADDNNHEDANSNEGFDYFRDLVNSSSQSTAGPSSRNPPTPPRLTQEQQLKSLSPHLQKCINSACAEFNILTREELDAFLIHVKNKSKPSELARNYIGNPRKLKRLLEEVINTFFKTPGDVTKEDNYFINWLKGIVKRFDDDDSIDPKKRKISDLCRNDPPNKK